MRQELDARTQQVYDIPSPLLGAPRPKGVWHMNNTIESFKSLHKFINYKNLIVVSVLLHTVSHRAVNVSVGWWSENVEEEW